LGKTVHCFVNVQHFLDDVVQNGRFSVQFGHHFLLGHVVVDPLFRPDFGHRLLGLDLLGDQTGSPTDWTRCPFLRHPDLAELGDTLGHLRLAALLLHPLGGVFFNIVKEGTEFGGEEGHDFVLVLLLAGDQTRSTGTA